mmetsp:Transcript_58937/g.129373  ORF Transcript_58937/g.129373 Transcript_58937/m.129373 type:complete len:94 (-) Transcript_58937:315-596(-)
MMIPERIWRETGGSQEQQVLHLFVIADWCRGLQLEGQPPCACHWSVRRWCYSLAWGPHAASANKSRRLFLSMLLPSMQQPLHLGTSIQLSSSF